jgi:hypothetical protein
MDRGDRIAVILLAPSKGPACAAKRPSAETNARNVKIGGAK